MSLHFPPPLHPGTKFGPTGKDFSLSPTTGVWGDRTPSTSASAPNSEPTSPFILGGNSWTAVSNPTKEHKDYAAIFSQKVLPTVQSYGQLKAQILDSLNKRAGITQLLLQELRPFIAGPASWNFKNHTFTLTFDTFEAKEVFLKNMPADLAIVRDSESLNISIRKSAYSFNHLTDSMDQEVFKALENMFGPSFVKSEKLTENSSSKFKSQFLDVNKLKELWSFYNKKCPTNQRLTLSDLTDFYGVKV